MAQVYRRIVAPSHTTSVPKLNCLELYTMCVLKKIDKTMRNRVFCGQGFPTMCGMPGLDNVATNLTFAVQDCIILRGSWVALYPCYQFWRFCGVHIDFLGSL